MLYKEWILSNDEYEHDKRQSRNALFTLGNGYFGIRGFFEEDEKTIESNGGIYMAGVTGMGTYDAWEGKSGELCNVPNVLRVSLRCNGEAVDGFSSISDFNQTLNMQKATYSRQYIWTTSQGKRIWITFGRFASAADIHKIGQRIIVKALDGIDYLSLSSLLDSNVTNFNADSFATPMPIQPGRNHFVKRSVRNSSLSVTLDDPDSTVLYFAQKVIADVNGNPVTEKDFNTVNACGTTYDCSLRAGDALTVEKIVYTATSLDEDLDAEKRLLIFCPVISASDRNFMITAEPGSINGRWRILRLKQTQMIPQFFATIFLNFYVFARTIPTVSGLGRVGLRGRCMRAAFSGIMRFLCFRFSSIQTLKLSENS
ncbi:MAG: hypothetical protein PHR14_09440 [Oscillospiraceae bacterium]|nr:hypothetical protein [Oscillospiraceae bacterium]